MKCEKTTSAPGIFVRTYTTHGGTVDCAIGGKGYLTHHVVIENLQLYEADISCVGAINSNPQSVEFDSSTLNPLDSSRKWHASTKLPDSGSKEFDHVRIRGLGSSHENIWATIDVTWPDPAETDSVVVSIEVTP